MKRKATRIQSVPAKRSKGNSSLRSLPVSSVMSAEAPNSTDATADALAPIAPQAIMMAIPQTRQLRSHTRAMAMQATSPAAKLESTRGRPSAKGRTSAKRRGPPKGCGTAKGLGLTAKEIGLLATLPLEMRQGVYEQIALGEMQFNILAYPQSPFEPLCVAIPHLRKEINEWASTEYGKGLQLYRNKRVGIHRPESMRYYLDLSRAVKYALDGSKWQFTNSYKAYNYITHIDVDLKTDALLSWNGEQRISILRILAYLPSVRSFRLSFSTTGGNMVFQNACSSWGVFVGCALRQLLNVDAELTIDGITVDANGIWNRQHLLTLTTLPSWAMVKVQSISGRQRLLNSMLVLESNIDNDWTWEVTRADHLGFARVCAKNERRKNWCRRDD